MSCAAWTFSTFQRNICNTNAMLVTKMSTLDVSSNSTSSRPGFKALVPNHNILRERISVNQKPKKHTEKKTVRFQTFLYWAKPMQYNAALPRVSRRHACSMCLDLAGMDNCIEREGRRVGWGNLTRELKMWNNAFVGTGEWDCVSVH